MTDAHQDVMCCACNLQLYRQRKVAEIQN